MTMNCICRSPKAVRYILLAITLILAGQLPCRAQFSGSSLADIKAAAEAGNPAAEDELAEQFLMRMDLTQAKFWYRKAAEQDYAHAQGKLGDILFNRARVTFGLKPEVKAAIGSEAIKWLFLGANQGDKTSQADLATAYLDGSFVQTNLVEAYKWGDLAAEGSPLSPSTVTGSSVRDAATLRMSTAQIAEAKQRVATFRPRTPSKSEMPEPSWVKLIKLSGLSGPANARLAIINDQTFAKDDSGVLKVAGQVVKVHCLDIREESALVQIEGLDKPIELTLQEN